ncbi:MAG: AAA family ATPase [Actinobacteria bacterium]|nr:AAA family ATPase [Actinomycetota bacterium]
MSDDAIFVTRARFSNFKSLKACDVPIGALAILVGPNGSGKSNFLDAFRFTGDALTTTLDHALRDRGGINEVRRRSGGHPNNFALRFDFRLADGSTGHYAYKVGAMKDSGFHVTDEECLVVPNATNTGVSFRVKGGKVSTTLEERLPAVVEDRLFLVSASNIATFRPVFDAFTRMGFYNLSPAAIRQPQPPDPGTLLRRDGSNLPSVLGHLEKQNPSVLARVVDYLRLVSPGVEGVSKTAAGSMETIEFHQRVSGQQRPWRFAATNMSDGTLRGLGILVAILQANGRPPSLVGIEEPEVALHPAAVGILIDALAEASRHTQLLVTSHSPDLLESETLDADSILAVLSDQGVTTIGPLDIVGREALRDRLFTAGEMLRMNQLAPSQEALTASKQEQLRLFEL